MTGISIEEKHITLNIREKSGFIAGILVLITKMDNSLSNNCWKCNDQPGSWFYIGLQCCKIQQFLNEIYK